MKRILPLLIITLFLQSIEAQTIVPAKVIKASSVKKSTYPMEEVQLSGMESQQQQMSSNIAGTIPGEGSTAGLLTVSNTGAPEYTIPVQVPPGINGVEPEIAITYNGQGGNGSAGYGWNISGVSAITRIPSTLYHDSNVDAADLDEQDRFALDGQRLILKSGTYGEDGAEYRTESYSNIKITSHGSNPIASTGGPSYFTVIYSNGAMAVYGNENGSRSAVNYSIAYWQDSKGSRINYEYETGRDSSTNIITKIKYGGTATKSAINEIQFIYYLRRRPEQSYVNGLDLRNTKILKKIKVFGSSATLFKEYELTHDYTSLDYERLISVRELSGDGSKSKKPIVFQYGSTEPGISDVQRTTVYGVDINRQNAGVVPFDFNGNGKMDFVVYPTTGTHAFKKLRLFDRIQDEYNNDYGREFDVGKFSEIFAINWKQLGTGQILSQQGLVLVQENEGNKVNFKMMARTSTLQLGNWVNKSWDAPTYVSDISCGGSSTLKIPQKYIAGDFDGDGLPDIIAIGLYYNKFYCDDPTNPCNCQNYPSIFSKVNLINLDPDLTSNFTKSVGSISDQLDGSEQIYAQDFNGNGKTDLMVFKQGRVSIYEMDQNNSLQKIYQKKSSAIKLDKPILLGDYNGDGKTDFMIPFAENSNYFYLFRSTGKSFEINTKTNPFKYRPTIYTGNGELDGYSLIPVDINGDSRTDIIQYDTKTSNDSDYGYQYITIYHNTKTTSPDILPSFTYATSKDIYGKLGHLPIPVFLNSKNSNSNLEFASISRSSLHSFTLTEDHREDMSLEKITSNGMITEIDYSRVTPGSYRGNDPYQAYTQDYSQVFPYVNINVAPSFKVVANLEENGAGHTRYQQFKYAGAVSHVQGLGFLGFKKIKRSNWYGANVGKLWSISTYDPLLRGALKESVTASTSSPSPSDYLEKSEYFYNYKLGTNPSSPASTSYPTILKINNVITGPKSEKATQSITLLPGFSANGKNGPYTAEIVDYNKLEGAPGYAGVFNIMPIKVIHDDGLTNVRSTTTYKYDDYNNPIQVKTFFPNGENTVVTTYSNNISANNSDYHMGRPLTKKEVKKLGGETFSMEEKYSYDNNMLSSSQVKGEGTPWITEELEYDSFGNITQKTVKGDGLTARTESYEYSADGRFVIEVTGIEGLHSTLEHESVSGNISAQTDPYGRKSTFTYDTWYRIKSQTDHLDKTSNYIYTYLSDGKLKTLVSNPDNSAEEVIYNMFGWELERGSKTLNGQWSHIRTEHDVIGRPSRVSEPYFNSPTQWNQYYYDSEGRMSSQTLNTGRVVNYSYSDLVTTVNDGVKTAVTTSDALGNIVRVKDPGGTVNYSHYANGMIKEADYGNHKITTKIDAWGRKVSLKDPSAGTYTYSYDIFGELLEEITPKGKTTIKYDDFGRIASKMIKGDQTNLNLTYDYDDGSTELLVGISGQDAINNRSYDYIYEYDHTNYERLKSIKEINDLAQFEKHLKYDDLGRVKTEKYISKNISNGVQGILETRNVYDPASGLLIGIYDNISGTGEKLWELDRINSRGQILKSTLGNGIISNREYDPYGFVKKIEDKKSGTSGPIALNLSYIFDYQRGNLRSRDNIKLNWQESFGYDSLNRLTTISGSVTKTNGYDNFGRITSATDVGDYSYQSDNRYRLEEIDPNTQGDGYYSQHASQQITYNAYKKPVEIHEQGHGRVSFEYGPMMNRSHAFFGGEESNKLNRRYHKHYSSIISAEIVEDKDENTTKIINYIGGDAYTAPIVHIKKNGSNGIDGYHYLHRDYLGSILAISDPDGNIKEERQFGAWGKMDKFLENGSLGIFSHGSLLGRGYTGHEHFFEVGLIHMNGRMYDAKLGRFLSPDNYIQDPFSTQNFNRYGYVLNNPLKYRDPSGEQSIGGGEGGLTPGQQVGIGGILGTALHFLKDAQIGRWLDRNATSAWQDYTRPYEEVYKFFKRLFGGGNGDRPQSVRFSNAINSDIAVRSSPSIPSLFTSSGIAGSSEMLNQNVLNSPKDSDSFWPNLKVAAGLLDDWLFYGDQNQTFKNDNVSRAFMNSRVVGEARDYWYKEVNAGRKSPTDGLTNFRGEKRIGGGNFGFTGLFKAGIDPIEQFVGSTRNIKIESDGLNLTYLITNVTSFESLMYGLTPEWLNFYNTKQTYIFSEPVYILRIKRKK